jgi:hypothetical protein
MKDTMKRVRRIKFGCVASVTALFFILSGQTIVAQTFTAPNGIVYSNVELDRVTGKMYLTSPDDKLHKVEVSGLDSGKLIFTLVPKSTEHK